VLFFVTFLPQFTTPRRPCERKTVRPRLRFIASPQFVNAFVILVAGRFVAAAKANPRALRLSITPSPR